MDREALAVRHNAVVDEVEALQRRILRLKKTQGQLQSVLQASGRVGYRPDGRVSV